MSTPYNISEWYPELGYYAFPTLFLRLSRQQMEAIKIGDSNLPAARDLIQRASRIIEHIPGASFLHADIVAPTDSILFQNTGGAIRHGNVVFSVLVESRKFHDAVSQGLTNRIGFSTYRRMDVSREFRLFIYEKKLIAASQRFLTHYHPHLKKREVELWNRFQFFLEDISPLLKVPTLCIDIYLTSTSHIFIIDMNPWGPPTDPLLLRHWNHDGSSPLGLLLVKKPTKLKGDITVSF